MALSPSALTEADIVAAGGVAATRLALLETGAVSIPQAVADVQTARDQVIAAIAVTPANLQTNLATPAVPPPGVASGSQYWAAITDGIQLYLNTSGAGAPVTPAVIQYGKGYVDALAPGANAAKAVTVIATSVIGSVAAWTSNVTGPGGFIIGTVAEDGTVPSVTLPITNGGNLNVIVERPAGGNNLTNVLKYPVTATAGQDNTWASTQFGGEIPVLAGDKVGFELFSGQATVKQLSPSAGSSATGIAGAVSGTQTWSTGLTRIYGGTFQFKAKPKLVLSETNLDTPLKDKLAAGGTALASVTALAGQVNTNQLGAEAAAVLSSRASSTIGTSGATWNGNLGVGAYQIGAAPASGMALWVSLPITTAGPLNIVVVRPTGVALQFTEVQRFPVTALTANSENVWSGTALSGGIVLQPDDRVVYELIAGGATVKNQSPVTGGSAIGLAGAVSGTQTWSGGLTRIYGGTFGFQATAKLSLPASNLASTARMAISRPVVTFNQGFGGSAPASWTFGGTWTHPMNGALSPVGAADMTVFAKLTQTSLLHDEERVERFTIQPQVSGAIFACGLYRSSRAILAIVNDTDHTLSFAAANNGSSGTGVDTNWTAAPTTFIKPVAMPALVAGRDYRVALRKDRRVNTVTVRDMVTGLIIATTTDGSNEGVVIPQSGLHHGSPFVAVLSGQVLLHNIVVNSARKNPRFMCIMDSNGEAPFDANVTLNQRSTQIIKDAVGGNAVIACVSGSTAAEITPLLAAEIPAIKPEWIIACWGHNEQNGGLATYQAGIEALMAYCAASGSSLGVFRLNTVPGRSTNLINDYIDTLPQTVRRIRQDLALTLNNDGVTYVAGYYGPDQIHRNSTGMALEAARIMADLPEIFDVVT